MSAKVTITSVDLNAVPPGNITCTVRLRFCGSTGAWTLVSNAVLVQPDGDLVAPLVITGLQEGACYEFEFRNNCGGGGVIKQVVTAGTQDALAFTNDMSEGSIIGIFKDGGATNLLSGPILPGETFNHVAPNLYGFNHQFNLVIGLTNGARVYSVIAANKYVLGGTYVTYAGVSFIAHNGVVPPLSSFHIRDANAHLDKALYTTDKGGISGVCTIGAPSAGNVTRPAAATADAVYAAEDVKVNVEWTPDNGEPPVSFDYIFNAADTSVAVTSQVISASVGCSDVVGVPQAVTIEP